MTAFTRENVLHVLRAAVVATAYRQITDPAHPDEGATVGADTGIAEAGHVGTCAFLTASALLALAGEPDGDVHLARATRAAMYLLRAQRPSGLIDLRGVNYDSPPDTAFAVQQLGALLALGRAQARSDAAWLALAEPVETFLRRAADGVAAGGFHTPNHRWVIAGALAQLTALFPDLAPALADPLHAYLIEGFDADDEGAYLERSVAVYDAVTNRSLLFVADHINGGGNGTGVSFADAARAAVRANLNFDLSLLHADGTAETSLSRRQDAGTRPVPLALAAPYFHAGITLAEPRFVRAAATIWEAVAESGDFHRIVDVLWLTWTMLTFSRSVPDEVQIATFPTLPAEYTRFFPRNRLWRVRRGPLSASVFGGTPRLLDVIYGAAEITALSISQSYFGVGNVVGDTLTADGDTLTLHFAGDENPRRPGYDLPLGRPVPVLEWHDALSERVTIPRPRLSAALTVTAGADHLALRYRTEGGMDGITGQIALDFAPGGIWETGDTLLAPQPGQTLFLKGGSGTMRYGPDILTISPGLHAHTAWALRGATLPAAPDCVRVLLTFVTPVDHAFTIFGTRGGRGVYGGR